MMKKLFLRSKITFWAKQIAINQSKEMLFLNEQTIIFRAK